MKIKLERMSRYYLSLFLVCLIVSSYILITPDFRTLDVQICIQRTPVFFENQSLAPKIFFPDKAPWKPLTEPVLGPQYVIAILVDFNDTQHYRTRDDFNDLIFSKLNDYITEISYNKTWIVGNITDWNQLNKNMSYYGKDSEKNRDSNLYPLFKHSILSCDDEFNFSKYEHIMIIHAGLGQETSGQSNDIWSSYATYYPSIQVDGIFVDKAMIVPEAEDLGLELLGVFAHEFLHCLGLPDLYDAINPMIGYAGLWGIMDRGVCNGKPPGTSPSHPMGWSKIQLGWINTIEKVNVGDFLNTTILSAEFEIGNYSKIIKLPTNEGYYLLEARDKIGFDKGLPDQGIILTYVDITKPPNRGGVKVIDADPSTPSLNDAAFNLENITFYDDVKNKISLQLFSHENNTYALMLDRREPRPELLINSIDIVISNDSSREATFFVEIVNLGKIRARNFYVISSIDDNRLYQKRISLGSNSTFTFKISKIMESGEHTFTVKIDPMNSVKEYEESNNEVIEKIFLKYLLEIETGEKQVPIIVNELKKLTSADGSASFQVEGGIHNITVPYEIKKDEGERLKFVGWENLEQNNTRILNITKDTSINCSFIKQFYLKIESELGNTLGEGWYDEDTYAEINVKTPKDVIKGKTRFIFKNWSGDINESASNPFLFMNRTYRIIANWSKQFYLNIESKNDGVMGEGWYESGKMANFHIINTIIQRNDSTMLFMGWSGDYEGDGLSAYILMDNHKSIKAIWDEFYKASFSVRGLPENVSMALIINKTIYNVDTQNEIIKWFKSGTSIEFQLLPPDIEFEGEKYVLSHWENSSEIISSPIRMDGSKYLSAIFIQVNINQVNASRLSTIENFLAFETPEYFGGYISPLNIFFSLLIIIILVAITSILNIFLISRELKPKSKFILKN